MTFRRILPMLAAFAVVLAGCASAPSAPGSADAAPSAAAPAGLVPVSVTVPDGLAAAPLDEPRQVLVPSGWTMSVFARVAGGPARRLGAGRRTAGLRAGRGLGRAADAGRPRHGCRVACCWRG